MKIDPKVEEILNKAARGEEIDKSDALRLLATVRTDSPELYALMATADQLTRDLTKGHGEVFAQVGINFEACPRSCKFCSMGTKWGTMKGSLRLSEDEVVERAVGFVRDGANAIFLMTTADYPFEDFLRMGKAVRNAIPADMPLVANIGDFGPLEAHALVEAGFTGVYHVVRLREGVDTAIGLSERVRTIESAKEAGLDLYYCIEPIGPEHSPAEIAEAIFLAKKFKPIVMAAMRRIPLPGTPLSAFGTITEVELAKVVAVIRLVFGQDLCAMSVHEPTMLPLRAGANQLYAETGANPRDAMPDTSKAGFAQLLEKKIAFSVPECRRMLIDAGWKPREGSSPYAGKSLKRWS